VRYDANKELDSGHCDANEELGHRQCGEIIDDADITLVTVVYTLVGVVIFPIVLIIGMVLLCHGQSFDICINVFVFVFMYYICLANYM
jgi:hypothetical protein